MKKPISNSRCMPLMHEKHCAGGSMPGAIMKKMILFITFVLCLTGCRKNELNGSADESVTAASFKAAASVKSITGHIKVMSFNTRHNDPADPQTITERQPLIRQIIVDNSPDIFGLQEFSDNSYEIWFMSQMATLGYGVYYDEAAGQGTPKVIFYKTNRFTLQSSGTVLIGAVNSATWAVLLDNTTARKYFISNSHWQYDSAATRMQNAKNLVASILQQNTESLPLIVFGDFNTTPGSPEVEYLKSNLDLVDALGNSNGGPTFHHWASTGTNKIDWMTSNRSMAYTASTVIETSYNGFWPSDHWPVMAWFIPAIFSGPHSDVNGISASSITKYSFADVNGDGKDDKIYWNTGVDSGKPRVFLSNGNGTFAVNPVVHTTGASTYSTTRYYYTDLDGDGKDDEILWTPTLNAGHTRVCLATSDGNFSSTIIDNPEGTSGSNSTIYHFADVNGDGKADKIYWNPTFDSRHTRVYLATSGGSFSGAVVSGPEGSSTTAGTMFYYADVNGDNKADKILWHPTLSGGAPMVYLSDGDGTFTASSTFSNSGAGSQASATVFYFADVNGDGRADKIYWNPSNYLGQPKIYYSETTNIFNGPVYSLRGTSQSANTYFYFSDITGDGKADQNRWNYAEYSGQLRNYFGL